MQECKSDKSNRSSSRSRLAGKVDNTAFDQIEMLRRQCDMVFGILQSKASNEDLNCLHELLKGKVSHQQLRESLDDKVSSTEVEAMLSTKLDYEAFEQLEMEIRIGQANLKALFESEDRTHYRDPPEKLRPPVAPTDWDGSLQRSPPRNSPAATEPTSDDNAAQFSCTSMDASSTSIQAAIQSSVATLSRATEIPCDHP